MTYILSRNFGVDPEFPIINTRKNILDRGLEYIIPPISLIEDYNVKYELNDNKKKQFISGKLNELDFSFIEDGAALELNISPTNDIEAFYKTIFYAKATAESFIKKISPYFSLRNDTVAFFDLENYWNNRGEDFRECVIFGCDPDSIPYIYKEMKLIDIDNDDIIDATNHDLRYFGGHLHIQNMTDDRDLYLKMFDYVAVVFDFIVGLNNVILSRSMVQRKHELLRLKYYGHPGRARIQEYSSGVNGYEYRPLSNFWIKHSNTIHDILVSANLAANIIENNFSKEFFTKFEDKISEMYSANILLNDAKANKLLLQVYKWLLKEGIMNISDCKLLKRIKK